MKKLFINKQEKFIYTNRYMAKFSFIS